MASGAAQSADLTADQVMAEFRSCLERGAKLAAGIAAPILRKKIFDGQVADCTAIRDAKLETVWLRGQIDVERRKQSGIDREIAAITESLMVEMRAELGL